MYYVKKILGYIVTLLLLYLFIRCFLGIDMSPERFFTTITKIPFEELHENKALLLPSEFLFPLLKTIELRSRYFLLQPQNDRPLPHLDYLIRSRLRYDENNNVQYWKDIYCIVKNLGVEPIVIKDIKHFNIKQSGDDITVDPEELISDIHAKLYESKTPSVLYEAEEILLFGITRNAKHGLIEIELAIDFFELQNEEKIFTLLQKDIVDYDEFRTKAIPKRLRAKTTFYSLTEKVDNYEKVILTYSKDSQNHSEGEHKMWRTIIGYILAILSSTFFINWLYSKIFVKAENEMEKKARAGELRNKKGNKIKKYKRKFQTRSTITPRWLGVLEQLLYITSIISGNYPFIPVWLGFKVAGIWKVWEESGDRISYNMFIIGNALSLGNAILWSIIIKPSILNIP